MKRKRFICNNEYYEYGAEEMSPWLYEEKMLKELADMLSNRSFLIES